MLKPMESFISARIYLQNVASANVREAPYIFPMGSPMIYYPSMSVDNKTVSVFASLIKFRPSNSPAQTSAKIVERDRGYAEIF